MGIDRRLAKWCYWVGGKLSRITAPQRTYRIVSIDPFVTEKAGWITSSIPLSMKFLKWSMRWDWDHWDHWATTHDACEPVKCRECGGDMCRGDVPISVRALEALAQGEPFDDVVSDYGVSMETVLDVAPLVGREPPIFMGYMSLDPKMFDDDR